MASPAITPVSTPPPAPPAAPPEAAVSSSPAASAPDLSGVSDEDFFSSLESALSEASVPDEPQVVEELAPNDEDIPVQEPEADPFGADEVVLTDKTGKEHKLPAPDVESVMRALDFQRLIQEKVPNATPELVEGLYATQVKIDGMIRDLDSGNPDSLAHMTDFIMGSRDKDTPGIIAAQLIQRLPQADPAAYKNISDVILKGLTEEMYQEAINSGDENALIMAQRLDHRLTGTFRTKENFVAQDPRDTELKALRAEREQRLQNEQKQAREAQRKWHADTVTAVNDGVTAAVEDAIKVVAALKDVDGGRDYAHIKRDLEEAVSTAFEANPSFKAKFQMDLERAVQLGTEQARANVVAQMKAFAEPVIRLHRRRVIEPHYNKIKSQSRGAEQRAAAATTRTAPVSVAPAAPSTGPDLAQAGTFSEALGMTLDIASRRAPSRR